MNNLFIQNIIMKKKISICLSLALILTLTIVASAATLSPWASISSGLNVEVATSFTPSWKTEANDTQYGVSEGKYIKNSWVRIVEGDYDKTEKSKNYYRPSTEWVYTHLSKTNNPFKTATATATYGWGYQ
jgi:hypothetical protein